MTKNQPFTNATDYDCWSGQNCDRCKKAGDIEEPGSSSCEIFEAIHDAACGIDIPDEIALRFGVIEDGDFEPFLDCPEKEVSE